MWQLEKARLEDTQTGSGTVVGLRMDLQQIANKAIIEGIRSVNSLDLVKKAVRLHEGGTRLLLPSLPSLALDLSLYREAVVVGAGKATGDMARGILPPPSLPGLICAGLLDRLPRSLPVRGCINAASCSVERC